MAVVSGDIIAVLRCAPFAVGLPSVLAFVCFETRPLVDAFDRIVAPMIDQAITDPERNRGAGRALLGTGLKVSLAMSGYATMAGVRFNAELAMLGGSFTRVYDDLFDNFPGQRLEERMAGLFEGRDFEPASDVEALLLALYRDIERRLARPRSDPIFDLLAGMHVFQCESRRQLDPRISAEEVRRITEGKGGFGTAVLFALFKPDMPVPEQDLLCDLGGLLQLLDDLNDAPLDRAAGVVTEATLDTCGLTDVAARMRRSRFAAAYGRGARRMTGMLLMVLAGGALRRRGHQRRGQPRVPLRRPAPAGAGGRRWLLFAPVENLRPGPPVPPRVG
jgi:hypothetical protein